jgi:hypothetical protein
MRVLAVLAVLCLALPAAAAPRHVRHRGFCTPVYIEGAGTVRICAPARGR